MARIKHGTLTNTQVDITLDRNYEAVEVLARSADADLWAVADPEGVGSIVAADDVDVVPSGGGSVIIDSNSNRTPTVVRLQSTGTIKWSLKGLN